MEMSYYEILPTLQPLLQLRRSVTGAMNVLSGQNKKISKKQQNNIKFFNNCKPVPIFD